MLRTVCATRYVTPLREGGSLPAIIEADDLGLYVLKFRGAGQGPLALVAELVAGEIGRKLGLKVPELVFVEVDPVLGRSEPDAEIQDLLQSSMGLNLGMDYLPGSVMFDPAAGETAEPGAASAAVWFDAFVTNVDRTPRNPNLLCWHNELYFIDHGAAMYFHHGWEGADSRRIRELAAAPFAPIRDHVLLPWATALLQADADLRGRVDESAIQRVVQAVPDSWLRSREEKPMYVEYFLQRLKSGDFLQEALDAQAKLV
ncbi:MAG TPA: HipA family kinase [Bryobacteraceae bacterium]|nr:HipA family kinase [Bryobacteraceae bacterium]